MNRGLPAVLVFAVAMFGPAGCRPKESTVGNGRPAEIAEPASAASAGTSERPGSEVDPAALRDAIRKAAGYIVRACDGDGRFVYKINLDPDVEIVPQYNMLRHGGTIYALGMYNRRHPDEAARLAMIRAAKFLKTEALAPVDEDAADMLAVWSDARITRSGRPLQAKLGGAGLGLVALMSVEQIHPGFTPLEDLRRLGRFIAFMQKEDGSFHAKYIPGKGGRNDEFVSLYYPGEAALGLLMLYEKDPSPVWMQSAAKCIAYLARSRRDKIRVEADHWALLATAKMLSLLDADHPECSRTTAVEHAEQICRSILDELPRYPPSRPAEGCLTADGRTCPTATRLEGLLAALEFLPADDAPLHDRIEATARRGTAFLLRAQVARGRNSGAITRTVPPGTDRRATEVRIDYVQHALSAMVQYEQKFTRR